MDKRRALVIDGNSEARRTLAELVLDPSEYDTIEAQDGDEGIRLAQQESPDLIIVNHQLPKTDGLAVLEKLRQQCRDTPVLLMTDQGALAVALRGFRLGAQSVVPKPFEIDDFRETVRQIARPPDWRQEGGRLSQQLADANQRLQRQHRQLDAIQAAGRAIVSSLDLNTVLMRALDKPGL